MAEVDQVTIPTIPQPTAGEQVATLSKAMKTLGVPADAANDDPTDTGATATQIGFFKGLLKGLGKIGDTAWTSGTGTLIALLKALATIQGTTAGAAVITDANGTIQQYLRGLVKRWADAIGAGTAAAALRVTLASDGVFASLTGAINETAAAAASTSVGLHGLIAGLWANFFGAKTDAKSTATDTTAVSAMSVWKQISASVQTFVTSIGAVADAAWVSGSGSAIAILKTVAENSASFLTTLGTLSAAKEINPDAASASQLSLLRGILQKTIDGISNPGQNTMDNSFSTATASDDSMLAAIDGRTVQLVPTCNTDAHSTGDLIAATEILAAVTRANDKDGTLLGLTLARLDSATGVAVRVWFLKANSSMGTESSAFAMADADSDDVLFYVDYAAVDFVSLGTTNCFAQKTEMARKLKPATGTDDVYIAITALGSVDLAAATDLVLTAHCG